MTQPIPGGQRSDERGAGGTASAAGQRGGFQGQAREGRRAAADPRRRDHDDRGSRELRLPEGAEHRGDVPPGRGARSLARGRDGGRTARGGRVRGGLALVRGLVTVALAVQCWLMAAGLSYAVPVHGYASMVILLAGLHLVHLALTAVATLLLFGRTARGLLIGRGYLVEAAGYWWYYVAVLGILVWVLGALA